MRADGRAFHDVPRDRDDDGPVDSWNLENVRRRDDLAARRELAGRRAVFRRERGQRFGETRHDDRVSRPDGSCRRSKRQHMTPALIATAAVQRAQDVIQRDEVDAAFVDNRHADHVAARAEAPGLFTVLRRQAVEEDISRADVYAVVERQDVARRPAEAMLPNRRACLDA